MEFKEAEKICVKIEVMISAVILTKNEEKNIKDCLKSLSWCDQLVVVDDFSTDSTREIAEKMGAIVYGRHLQDNFSAQRNFALSKTKGDWIFFIDADERVTPILKKEIQSTINNQQLAIKAFYLKRKDKFLGKWLKHGETASVRLLRLAKKNTGKWQGNIHEVWQVKGKTKTLKHPILHDRQITISSFLKRINHYSTIRAKELFNQGEKTNLFLIIAFPVGKFIHNYFFKLGFWDGFSGFAIAFFMSFHSLLARCKLYHLWQKKD